MDTNVLIHDLLPKVDIQTLKAFASSNKNLSQVINNETFWEKQCDRDFWDDESYSCFTQVRDMENKPTWKKFYSRFYLMRKYQIDDQAEDFFWKGEYTFGYSWIRGTRIALTEKGGHVENEIGIKEVPDDCEKYFLYEPSKSFWLDSPQNFIDILEKQKEATNFEVTTGDNDIYLIKNKMNIIKELKDICKVAKFLIYEFKSV